jgi:hypothetical protein
MVAIYTGSFPPDPKTDLKNFQRKQAEYRATYRRTREPLALFEALLNARAFLQLPADLDWLMVAMGDIIMRSRTNKKGRPSKAAERFQDRMCHAQRYLCVRNLRQKGHTKDDALDLAVAALEAAGDPATRPTIENSYDLVYRDLKQAGPKSEFSVFVARGEPAVVPVSVTQQSDGLLTINGVTGRWPRTIAQERRLGQERGVTRGPRVRGADTRPSSQGG